MDNNLHSSKKFLSKLLKSSHTLPIENNEDKDKEKYTATLKNFTSNNNNGNSYTKSQKEDEKLTEEEVKIEDHILLRNKKKQMKFHKQKSIENELTNNRTSSSMMFKCYLESVLFETKEEKYLSQLETVFLKESPFIYLTCQQKDLIRQSVRFKKFPEKILLYSGIENLIDCDLFSAYILMSGEIHVFNNKEVFQDLIDRVILFGYDGPIFKKRFNTVLIEKDSVVAVIERNTFLKLIQPGSKFASFIARSIVYKDKILDRINSLKSYIIHHIDKGNIDLKKLVHFYKETNPCLHPLIHSDLPDLCAWTYALNRLPKSIFETYMFVLLNKAPKILSTEDEIAQNIIPRVFTNARHRDVYKYLDGKNVILVREMESDVLDFISNMCIHVVEACKVRNFIASPITVEKLYKARGDFDKALAIFEQTSGYEVKAHERESLRKCFGNDFADKLITLVIHHQDYNIEIIKLSLSDKDSIELWTENLWSEAKKLLGVEASVEELDDLVVDIMQGSKRTLLACVSPYVQKNRDEIISWAESRGLKTQTKNFLNQTDKLIAYSFYYFKEFPEKLNDKQVLDIDHGILHIEQTFATGVQVLLINVNKLDPNFIDPSIKLKPASKQHIILHIGYTFGAQSGHIIKPLLMLFGAKARSFNAIGKAGGLVGNRTDILMANKMFYDKNHELSTINYGSIDVKEVEAITQSKVHIGPMLTVAGTILQNDDLLNFYKHVMGCVGLEMEGYYYSKEIENSIKHGLVGKDFITRCFYYASDLPLDSNQNLSKEEGNVSWDEGIGSMNAIQRYILKKIMSEDNVDCNYINDINEYTKDKDINHVNEVNLVDVNDHGDNATM